MTTLIYNYNITILIKRYVLRQVHHDREIDCVSLCETWEYLQL